MSADEMQVGRWVVGQGLVTPDADPFTPSQPSPEESARVASEAALLTAAVDRLERLLADGTDLPWRVDEEGGDGCWTIYGPDANAVWPVAGPYHEGGGVWERTDADLIAMMVNLGPALVAWLRSAARDAEEIGPDGFAVALARKVMGEER